MPAPINEVKFLLHHLHLHVNEMPTQSNGKRAKVEFKCSTKKLLPVVTNVDGFREFLTFSMETKECIMMTHSDG